MKNNLTQTPQDCHQFTDGEEITIFNHHSFCELIKHIMVKYGNLNMEEAQEKIAKSHLYQPPNGQITVALLSHELPFHWAMLLTHGELYWHKGIPSDYNDFREEYVAWEKEVMTEHQLKEPFEYLD